MDQLDFTGSVQRPLNLLRGPKPAEGRHRPSRFELQIFRKNGFRESDAPNFVRLIYSLAIGPLFDEEAVYKLNASSKKYTEIFNILN